MARYLALVPAAGTGSRMGMAVPKQYHPLHGQPLLWHTLRVLCSHAHIERVYPVLHVEDRSFDRFDWGACQGKLSALRCGGAVRAESVRNGLRALAGAAAAEDWVLVHDAARPCLTHVLIDRLINQIGDDADGGILAVPVADTLKRADADGRILETQPRTGLWQAQTPQMFRYGRLLRALEAAELETVTDEASAMEAAGARPKLVLGSPWNLKVTVPEDLQLASAMLSNDYR